MAFIRPGRPDMEDAEARRRERAERLEKPYGREMSQTSRRIATAIAIGALVAMFVLVIVGWLNVGSLTPSPLP